MSDPTEPDFEEAHAQLSEGLRSCRTVVSNYRALLAPEGDNDNLPSAFPEAGEASESAAD